MATLEIKRASAPITHIALKLSEYEADRLLRVLEYLPGPQFATVSEISGLLRQALKSAPTE